MAARTPPTPRRVNAPWHAAHRMPANPTLDERVAWHVEHATACGCRLMPETVLAALRERGRKPPRPPR